MRSKHEFVGPFFSRFLLADVEGVFSGHFPGPCTSLGVDFETKHVYFTDAGWRGRWNDLRSAAGRFETMWENGNKITNAVILNGAQFGIKRNVVLEMTDVRFCFDRHVLLSNGKVHTFPLKSYEKNHDMMEFQIELEEDFGSRWEYLLADKVDKRFCF